MSAPKSVEVAATGTRRRAGPATSHLAVFLYDTKVQDLSWGLGLGEGPGHALARGWGMNIVLDLSTDSESRSRPESDSRA